MYLVIESELLIIEELFREGEDIESSEWKGNIESGDLVIRSRENRLRNIIIFIRE